MDFTPLIPRGRKIIQGYKTGGFRISDENYADAVMVTPDQVNSWPVNKVEELHLDHFSDLVVQRPDIILLGTGKQQVFLESSFRKQLKEKNLFVEAMDTGAACRTFNVLMAEGRHVAAILLPL